MTLEIPSLAKAPSMKSLFGAVITQQKRFSQVLSTATSSTWSTASNVPPTEDVSRTKAQSIIREVPGEEAQNNAIKSIHQFLCSRMVDDIPGEKSCFIGLAVPPITLQDYLHRLVAYMNQWANDSPSNFSTGIRCLLIGVDYLLQANVRLTPRSVHRYIMMAMLAAAKYTEDFAISNQFWGEVGGCRLDDVNRMEVGFAITMNWCFRVTESSCSAYLRRFSIVPSY